jgi:predicted nucleotide-binding protein (sugar kinase/HSP70/actin superfamily)
MKTNGHHQNETVYVPYIGDHSFVVAAAMRSCGMNAVALPPSDDETMEIGLHYCRGSECSPCFTTIGDCVRLIRQSDFDPDTSTIFLPTTLGPCRYGQYTELLRDVLDREGFPNVDIASPSTANPFEGFGRDPVSAGRLMWQGIVAIDLLYKLLFEYRPYERNPGQTDQVYQEGLDAIVEAVEAGAETNLVRAMHFIAEQFEGLPVDMSQPRPLIGIVGEVYLRFNPCNNLDIIRRIEAAGGEVATSTMTEWVYHMIWDHMHGIWGQDRFVEWFALSVADLYQQHEERRYVRPVAHLLRRPYETPMSRVMDKTYEFYNPEFGDDTVLNVGKVVDFAEHGVSAIVNMMPFSCMPGIITSGLATHLRAELDKVPWLDITFDAQAETNIHTRIEALMHQARLFQQRHMVS